VKSGESNGSSAADASIGSIFERSGSFFGGVPCLIISQSRPSFCFVCTMTHSPSRRVPFIFIFSSFGFSSMSSYVPVSQIVIEPAP